MPRDHQHNPDSNENATRILGAATAHNDESKTKVRRIVRERLPLLIFLLPFVVIAVALAALMIAVFTQI